MTIKKATLGLILLCLSLTIQARDPKTVRSVNLPRYMGTWYEIAYFPNFFQRGCRCTWVHYTLRKGKMHILNRCYRGNPPRLIRSTGSGYPVAGSGNSKLKVQFFWPFTANYWILYVSKRYKEAIVGTPDRSYLWFIARKKHISKRRFRQLVRIARRQGYDMSQLKRTDQSCRVRGRRG